MLKKWSRKRLHFASASGKLGFKQRLPLFIEPVSNDDGVPGRSGAERFGEKADALRFL